MTGPITFRVDGLPFGKQTPGYNSKTHTFFKRTKTRAVQSTIGWHAKAAAGGRAALGCAIQLSIDIFVQPPKSWPAGKRAACLAQLQRPIAKPDTDNVLKAVKDGCNGILWTDDKQVCDDHVRRWYGPEDYLLVTVQPWLPEVAHG